MSKRKLWIYIGCLAAFTFSVLLVVYGIAATIHDVHSNTPLTVTRFVSNASHNTSTYMITRLHAQEHRNQIRREHQQHHTINHQVITEAPTRPEQKRMHAVIKYLNTNDRQYGITNFSYDTQRDQVLVTFNTKKPKTRQLHFAKSAVSNLDANERRPRK